MKQSPMCNFLYDHNRNKAPHLHVFTLIFTHFKWSKPGLKQNFEPSFPPINQDFLESCQYTAVIDEEQNYNMIDGRRNNMPLKGKNGRVSVLAKLRRKQAEIAKQSGKPAQQMTAAEDMERRRK